MGAVLAVVTYLQLCTRLPLLPRVRKEDQGKLSIWKLADLPCPLQCRDTIHDDVLGSFLAHNDAKLAKNYCPSKDRVHPWGVIFPRIVRAAPQPSFPAVRADLGEVFLGVFLSAGPLGLIISFLTFIPFHFR